MWYKKEIKKFIIENYKEIVFSLIFYFILVWVYIFYFKDLFTINYIEPISKPTLTLRLLSGLCFMWIWRLLYFLRFYLILKFIIVWIFRDKKLYKDLKKIIWYSWCFVTWYIIVPYIIDLINKAISVIYSFFWWWIFITPTLLIPLWIFFYLLYKQSNRKK